MAGKISIFLANDHKRLDRLLERAMALPGRVEASAYNEFRVGLLTHIGMEEKILLPAARRLRQGEPLAIADKLRRDHGALAALMVPTPTPPILASIRAILNNHNALEEGHDGVYEVCERLAGSEAESLVSAMRSMPEVRVVPHVDGPHVMEATCRALERAGYKLEEISNGC